MHRVDEEFAPALSQESGFIAYFAIETGENTIETISVFRDKAAAEQSDELAAEYVGENLGEFELTRTEVSAGDVLVSRFADDGLEDEHRWRTPGARLRAG